MKWSWPDYLLREGVEEGYENR